MSPRVTSGRVRMAALALALIPVGIALAQGAARVERASRADPADRPVAFIGVTVLPMDRDRALVDHTVIIEHGRISVIGPRASTPLPSGATIVAATGMYMLPGLADMHTHSVDPVDLASLLASGVTTILDMGFAPGDASPGFATPAFVRDERREWNSGQRAAPRILAALMIDGPQWSRGVQSAAAVDSAVALARSAGYEFLKIHGGFDARLLPEIFGAAASARLPAVGHLPRRVPLDSVLARMAMVAHGEEFLYTAFANLSPEAREARVAEVVATVRRSGVFVSPGLVTYAAIARIWGQPSELDSALAHPDAEHLTPAMRQWWSGNRHVRQSGSLVASLAFLRRFTLALHEAGVPLLVGTDAPGIPFVTAGPSVAGEIRELVGAGLTPFEALRSATAVPGAFLARYVPGAEPFGEVRVGYRADLLIVRGDPRTDLAALAHPVGVMRGGSWYDAATLRLERVRATAGSSR